MDSGKHVRELKSESLYDSIRKKWAERLTGVNVAGFHETGINSGEELAFPYPSSSKKDKQLMGWALKTVKRPSRMDAHVTHIWFRSLRQAGELGKRNIRFRSLEK